VLAVVIVWRTRLPKRQYHDSCTKTGPV
jgi:hypothetical protein